jgi:hypothetical protein
MSTESEPVHASPKRQRGGSETPDTSPTCPELGRAKREREDREIACPREVGELSKTVAQDLSQILAGQVDSGKRTPLRNEPGAAPRPEQVNEEQLTVDETTSTRSPAVSCSTDQLLKSAAPRSAPPSSVAAGTVRSTELRAGPSAEFRAAAVPSSIPKPAAPPRTNHQGPITNDLPTASAPPRTNHQVPSTNDQGPMTNDQPYYDLATELERINPYGGCRVRWNALEPELRERLYRVRGELLQYQKSRHLPEERVQQHIGFLLKHLG